MPVGMWPGAMQFTRTPNSARSVATMRLNWTIAALDVR